MKKIDLVFRTVGERTSKAALELAIKNIQPNQVHIIENVKPFTQAVQKMLQIQYDCDLVIFMDADCLILEDLNPFLQQNIIPYVDCYVQDKFRGNIHCGVHITRIDVVREMQELLAPEKDLKYVLKPESRLRDIALRKLNLGKAFKKFKILHDHFQYYRDIFVKYSIRELRSRTNYHQTKLDFHLHEWQNNPDDRDFQIAQYAIDYTRHVFPTQDALKKVDRVAQFIEQLPQLALEELNRINSREKPDFSFAELDQYLSSESILNSSMPAQPHKVFGIGLSRTGTKSLTLALNILGINVTHYPDDETTLQELLARDYKFSVLNTFDGITDITVASLYKELDRLFPHSKFILTVREKESWLRSLEEHWRQKPLASDCPEQESKFKLRRLLRTTTYGMMTFDREQASAIYDAHYRQVMEYFKDRPQDLLVIDICGGEGWEKLCPFLDQPILQEPFPYMHKKSELNDLLYGNIKLGNLV